MPDTTDTIKIAVEIPRDLHTALVYRAEVLGTTLRAQTEAAMAAGVAALSADPGWVERVEAHEAARTARISAYRAARLPPV